MAPSGRDVRRKALRRGALSEYLAAAFLLARGYRIVVMRFRTRSGEIDIIARKGDLVAFVEVKARRGTNEAVLAVDPSTQRRIRNASLDWIGRQKDSAMLSWRYDIVAVRPWRWPRHFINAF